MGNVIMCLTIKLATKDLVAKKYDFANHFLVQYGVLLNFDIKNSKPSYLKNTMVNEMIGLLYAGRKCSNNQKEFREICSIYVLGKCHFN